MCLWKSNFIGINLLKIYFIKNGERREAGWRRLRNRDEMILRKKLEFKLWTVLKENGMLLSGNAKWVMDRCGLEVMWGLKYTWKNTISEDFSGFSGIFWSNFNQNLKKNFFKNFCQIWLTFFYRSNIFSLKPIQFKFILNRNRLYRFSVKAFRLPNILTSSDRLIPLLKHWPDCADNSS